MLTRSLAGMIVLTLFSLPSLSHAQTDAEKAAGRTHFKAGQSYYESGEFESALREFKQALELSKIETLNYNVALCEERLNQHENAANSFEAYLAALPADDPQQVSLKSRISKLRAKAKAEQTEAAAKAEQEKLASKAVEAKAENAKNVDLQVPANSLDQHEGPVRDAEAPSKPFYKKAPFWIAVGAVVVVGVILAVVLGTRGEACEADMGCFNLEGMGL